MVNGQLALAGVFLAQLLDDQDVAQLVVINVQDSIPLIGHVLVFVLQGFLGSPGQGRQHPPEEVLDLDQHPILDHHCDPEKQEALAEHAQHVLADEVELEAIRTGGFKPWKAKVVKRNRIYENGRSYRSDPQSGSCCTRRLAP